MTPFDGGFSFPKQKDVENNCTPACDHTDPDYIATVFSPNLVAYVSLHASGRVTIHPMQSDPSSPLIPPVLAQKFTNALKKNVTFDDLFLVAEQYMGDGFFPLEFDLISEFAAKLVQLTSRFSGIRFEVSKELPVEQLVSQLTWSKLVSLQYNLYSRLNNGAKIAANGLLLLQLRTMFMAFMMSCKVDTSAGARGPKPQIMGRVWLAPKSIQREAAFKECKPLHGVV